MKLEKLFFLPMLVFLSNCASIVQDDKQILSVETPDCLEAKCKLSNDQGTFYISKTPGTVSINRSYSDMTIECSKGEYAQIITSESSTDNMVFGNILVGGIVGVIVDTSSGAAYEYDTLIQHPLSCHPSDSDENSAKKIEESSNLNTKQEAVN